MAEEQISPFVSSWASRYGNIPLKICLESWDKFWINLSPFSLSNICLLQLIFYPIQDLWHIRRYLTLDSANYFAHPLVSRSLDYGDSGTVDEDLTKLPCVRNQLVCVMTKSPPVTRNVPLLHFVHWQPVRLDLKSVCWPIKQFMTNKLLIRRLLATSLQLTHWDHARDYSGSRTKQSQRHVALVSHPCGTTPAICLSIRLFKLQPSGHVWWYFSLIWPFNHAQYPVEYLVLLLGFVIANWFCCCSTELLTRDIDAIEIWLISWSFVYKIGRNFPFFA